MSSASVCSTMVSLRLLQPPFLLRVIWRFHSCTAPWERVLRVNMIITGKPPAVRCDREARSPPRGGNVPPSVVERMTSLVCWAMIRVFDGVARGCDRLPAPVKLFTSTRCLAKCMGNVVARLGHHMSGGHSASRTGGADMGVALDTDEDERIDDGDDGDDLSWRGHTNDRARLRSRRRATASVGLSSRGPPPPRGGRRLTPPQCLMLLLLLVGLSMFYGGPLHMAQSSGTAARRGAEAVGSASVAVLRFIFIDLWRGSGGPGGPGHHQYDSLFGEGSNPSGDDTIFTRADEVFVGGGDVRLSLTMADGRQVRLSYRLDPHELPKNRDFPAEPPPPYATTNASSLHAHRHPPAGVATATDGALLLPPPPRLLHIVFIHRTPQNTFPVQRLRSMCQVQRTSADKVSYFFPRGKDDEKGPSGLVPLRLQVTVVMAASRNTSVVRAGLRLLRQLGADCHPAFLHPDIFFPRLQATRLEGHTDIGPGLVSPLNVNPTNGTYPDDFDDDDGESDDVTSVDPTASPSTFLGHRVLLSSKGGIKGTTSHSRAGQTDAPRRAEDSRRSTPRPVAQVERPVDGRAPVPDGPGILPPYPELAMQAADRFSSVSDYIFFIDTLFEPVGVDAAGDVSTITPALSPLVSTPSKPGGDSSPFGFVSRLMSWPRQRRAQSTTTTASSRVDFAAEPILSQCTLLSPTLRGDAARSSQFEIMHRGYDVTQGYDENGNNAALFMTRRASGLSAREKHASAWEDSISAVSPHCLLVRTRPFYFAGGLLPMGFSSFDMTLSGVSDGSHLPVHLELMRRRVMRLELTMEAITLAEVHSSGPSLRHAVREAYGFVVKATTLWESASGRPFDTVASTSSGPRPPTIDVPVWERINTEDFRTAQEVEHFTTENKLIYYTRLVEQALKVVSMLGKIRNFLEVDEAAGWDLSLRVIRGVRMLRGFETSAFLDGRRDVAAGQNATSTALSGEGHPLSACAVQTGADDGDAPDGGGRAVLKLWDRFCSTTSPRNPSPCKRRVAARSSGIVVPRHDDYFNETIAPRWHAPPFGAQGCFLISPVASSVAPQGQSVPEGQPRSSFRFVPRWFFGQAIEGGSGGAANAKGVLDGLRASESTDAQRRRIAAFRGLYFQRRRAQFIWVAPVAVVFRAEVLDSASDVTSSTASIQSVRSVLIESLEKALQSAFTDRQSHGPDSPSSSPPPPAAPTLSPSQRTGAFGEAPHNKKDHPAEEGGWSGSIDWGSVAIHLVPGAMWSAHFGASTRLAFLGERRQLDVASSLEPRRSCIVSRQAALQSLMMSPSGQPGRSRRVHEASLLVSNHKMSLSRCVDESSLVVADLQFHLEAQVGTLWKRLFARTSRQELISSPSGANAPRATDSVHPPHVALFNPCRRFVIGNNNNSGSPVVTTFESCQQRVFAGIEQYDHLFVKKYQRLDSIRTASRSDSEHLSPSSASSSTMTMLFGSDHTLVEEFALRDLQLRPMPTLHVVWYLTCVGCCGFASEVAELSFALERRVRLSLIPGINCFCSGYPRVREEALRRMHISTDEYVRRTQGDFVVWIHHTNPGMYDALDMVRRRMPDFFIGRSMYEFSRIGENWAEGANLGGDLDSVPSADVTEEGRRVPHTAAVVSSAGGLKVGRVWVPATFLKNIFAQSGVMDGKITVVPEAVDTNFYDPHVQAHVPLPPGAEGPRPFGGFRTPLRTQEGAVDAADDDLVLSQWLHDTAWWGEARQLASLDGVQQKDGTRVSDWTARIFTETENGNRTSVFGRLHASMYSKSEATSVNGEWVHWCNRPTPPQARVLFEEDTVDGAQRLVIERPYRFFSNFKWESRKGWDILFEAYARAFPLAENRTSDELEQSFMAPANVDEAIPAAARQGGWLARLEAAATDASGHAAQRRLHEERYASPSADEALALKWLQKRRAALPPPDRPRRTPRRSRRTQRRQSVNAAQPIRSDDILGHRVVDGKSRSFVIRYRGASLFVLSYIFAGANTPKNFDIRNVSWIRDRIVDWAKLRRRDTQRSNNDDDDDDDDAERDGRTEGTASRSPSESQRDQDAAATNFVQQDISHVCVITQSVTEYELAQLINSVDAFVLPTRGEGWGLPFAQSMSMGKPTIASIWGGQSEFMTSPQIRGGEEGGGKNGQVAYSITLDGVDEVPRVSEYGFQDAKKWSVPSVTSTARLMRYVALNPMAARDVGSRARRHIVHRYGPEPVADVIEDELQEIYETAWRDSKGKST